MSEWISTEDRLPEVSDFDGEYQVLAVIETARGRFVTMASLMDADGHKWLDVSTNAYNEPLEWYGREVTHWMPLPQLPPSSGDNSGSD